MKRLLHALSIIIFLFFLCPKAGAQGNQIVSNGGSTTAVNFAGAGCTYNWVNDTPGIGLAASGTGDIGSFTAVNTGSGPVVATITAMPAEFAYITNIADGTVSVLNIPTNTLAGTITVGVHPVGVSLSKDGTRVYITNETSNTVSVINAKNNTVIATIAVGMSPEGLAVTPDGSKLYVANNSSNDVSVINTSNNTVASTIPVGSAPYGIAISSDGKSVYVTNHGSTTVSVIAIATGQLVNTIGVGFGPLGITLSPDGAWIYVANNGDTKVSVINATTGVLTANIVTGTNPYGIAVSTDGSRVYVANSGSNTISVINSATNVVIANVAVGTFPVGVSVSPDNKLVYALDLGSSDIKVINAATSSVTSTIPISAPSSLGDFITGSAGCVPVTFTITVNATPVITAGDVTGSISACAGSASASPQIQQFTVSGSNMTGDITATAPPGFEVSLSAGSGYSNSVTITPSGGTVSSTTVYVRSGASASAGNISGNVTLSSPGATSQSIAVRGVVNVLPTVNAVPNQAIINGAPTMAVSFTGTGSTFNWVNDTPGIGLAASGTGDITSFTGINNGPSPVTAHITVTPAAGSFAYIANETDNTVSVINTATNLVVKTITVGSTPYGVTVSPDGTKAYVSNYGSNTVSVINTATNTVSATITGLGPNPEGIGISPDGSRLYVANANVGSTTSFGTVSVINTATNAVIASITVGIRPTSVWVSADGTRVYVTNFLSNTVSVIDAATNGIVASIAVGTSPNLVTETPDDNLLYVTNENSRNVSVISTATNALIKTINVGQGPDGLTISPDGTRVYVANGVSNSISVISTATNAVVLTYTAVNTGPVGVSLANNGSLLYVENLFSNNVTVIDVTNTADKALATIAVGSHPGSIGGNFITGSTILCTGIPVTFSITVNSTLPVITAGPVIGTITACAGTASASPNIQQFTVSGSNLTGNITASVPVGFEVSLASGSGFTNRVTINGSAGAVNGTIVYVRSAASATAGPILGKILLASPGAAGVQVSVSGLVNALPTVNPLGNKTVTSGNPTTPVSFTGPGNIYNWVNDTPGIGLAASGTGDIASFIATNTGASPVIATITVTPASAGYAYIANQGSNTVSVINTADNTLVATIPAGSNPYGVAVSPDDSRVYVTDLGDNTLSVIKTSTNTVVANVPIGQGPFGLAVSPDGSKVYVTNLSDNNVAVINTSTNAVSMMPVNGGTYDAVLSHDGSLLYLTNYYLNTVAVYNTVSQALVATVNVGSFPEELALSPDGKTLYAGNSISNNVSVINTITNTVTATINAGVAPAGLYVSPDGTRVYVANAGANTVSVIDAATNAVVGTIPVGNTPTGLSATSDGSLLYVVNSISGNISVINTATNVVIATFPVGNSATSLGNFITHGTGCTGIPATFTITVKPNTVPTITAGPATGNISACVGAASVSPNIQQFTVSGVNLTGNIKAAATAGFEVSLSAGSGFSSSVTLAPLNGKVSGTLVYVRSAASFASGDILGNIILTTPGAVNIQVAVKGTINPLPTINTINSQSVTNGNPTNPVNFTGTGSVFAWTNDTPSIGLAASGSGDIPAFTAINTGASPVTATITATPVSAGYAYIANEAAGTVSVVNTASNTVIATITVGSKPLGVSLNPDGSRAYVVNNSSNSVSVINTATNTVVATVSVGPFPVGIAVSPDGSLIYVADQSSNDVSVISAATNAVVSTIPIGSSPYGIAVSPDGSTVYTTNYAANTVSVINAATSTLTTTVPVGVFPIGVTMSPDGSRIYVTNQNSNTVSVIDASTNAVVFTIPVGSAPTGITASPDGGRVYVSNSVSNTVSVINTASNSVTAAIPAGSLPYGISVNADGSRVYVANESAGTVSVINTTTNSLTGTVTVGSQPYSFGNFVTASVSCNGAPVQFTITVKPTIISGIITGSVSGTISACAGTASVSPQVEQFTASGSNLTGDIVATATTGFEVSLTAGSGYASSVTLQQNGGTVNNTVIYVRSSVSAAAGSILGSVMLESTGVTSQTVAVTGTVNALAVINVVSNQTYDNGDLTSGVTFTGTAGNINWVNDTPGIGLAASGAGNIAPFTAINTGSTPVIATITATPIPAGFAYVGNFNSNTVSVINTASNAVVATIAVGPGPYGVSVSQDGSRVYVANNNSNTISVISTATNTVIATITVGAHPQTLSVSPDGSRVFVTNLYDNTVSVIDAATNAVLSTIAVGTSPFGISVSPDGSRVYVANQGSNNVSVINTASNLVIATIPVSATPMDIAVSPDGSRVYVTNNQSGTVSVINTTSNIVISNIPVGSLPNGITVSPDGSLVYVANNQSGTISVISAATNTVVSSIPVSTPVGLSVSADGSRLYTTGTTFAVINTATNAVITTVPAGAGSLSVGNFVVPSIGCPGPPVIFTITVNPSPPPPPGINFSAAAGSITACEGTASVSPDIQQFTVSGASLTDDIVITAPNNFEISLLPGSKYGNSLTLLQQGGTVNNTIIYVRSSALALSPAVSGNVTLTSTGVSSKKVPVTATINALPTVSPVVDQLFTNAIATTPINFTGTAGSYSWTNDTPAIGLAASGSGDIPSFIPVNNGNTPVIATIVVTPENNTGCTSPPVTFKVTVNPTPAGAITVAGALSPLTTVYGTPSLSESFTVSGTNMQQGILVSPPAGFEVSTDDITYSNTVTVGAAGSIAATLVYIRLASTTHAGNNYSGNIALTSNGAPDAGELMPASTVTPAKLVIIADDKSKVYGAANPVFTASYIGFVNNDGPAQLTSQPVITTVATTSSLVGQYPITIGGAASPDYNITAVDGILTITPLPQTVVIPNTFTPNGDGINDTWNIKYIDSFPNCTVEIFNRYGEIVYSSVGYGVAWDGTYKGATLPTGTYYYIVNLKNGRNPLSGFVAIIR